MPLTPADIHNMAFKKPPIGKRGYDEEEVDAFLDELEQELIRLLEENNALHGQVQRGGAGGPSGPAPSSMALNAEFSDLSAQLERMQEARARAEQNARSIQARLEQARNATPAAPVSSPDSDDRNARVLMMAQRTADDHMRDARMESDALLNDARDKSDQITSDAQLKAGTIEGDARRNHSEAMNSLGTKRAALLDEIERLGQLAQSYQSALNSHLTQQLQDLDSVSSST
ncbi:DivIVA domain-containing protein [Actinoplanes friuliensis]|jgi:DivIVA domain-containing protein|uniref:Cell wall synthesis protein Wag31 n=1 Tax=Actinoplanes friuliensis DSM 7358 TaxID=1246995 RepID=U5W110_9ACTN|nr:DivIVA domain-containing protein [Actinoplanes friuliensis]AGZ41640.1 Laminin subunit beta-2 [Actinoplanes friuliensis DSM 7358]